MGKFSSRSKDGARSYPPLPINRTLKLHLRVPSILRSCLKFLAILKRLNFQGLVSGFCLPIGGYFGSFFAFFTSDSLAIFL